MKHALKLKSPVYLRLGKKNETNFYKRKKNWIDASVKKRHKKLLNQRWSNFKNVMDSSKILTKNKINHSVYDLRVIKPLSTKNLKYLT